MFRMNEKYLKSTLVDPLESERSFLSRFVGVAVKEIVRWEIKRGYLSPSPARSTITIR